MGKINIIIKKEYLTRVKKKSFVILTFLVPLLFVLISVLPTWIMSLEDTTAKEIVVIDKTNLYKDAFVSDNVYSFIFVDKSPEEIRAENRENADFTALLLIEEDLSKNPKAVTLYSEKQLNLETKTYISKILNRRVEAQKLAAHDIPGLKEIIKESKTDINIETKKWGVAGEEKESSAEMALAIGLACAFMIYFFITIYGTQVMTGVVQEKASRIVELIISSVSPFELMMGKIVGIALVALTQFTMWILLSFILLVAGSFLFMGNFDPSAMAEFNQMGGVSMSTTESQAMLLEIQGMLSSFNWGLMLSLFVVYFLGGYLLYASLFAAVGSAVDNETDAGQFTMPLMIPIMVAFFSAFYVVRSPDSAFAFWTSIIPFTSPIVMLVRLPFDVPTWQIVLSVCLLIFSFVGTTWLASKIYKTGILLYGKKLSWSDMWKWLRY